MEAENLDVFQNLNFDAMSEQEIYMAILMLQARHNMTSASITHWIQFINPQTTKRWQKVPTFEVSKRMKLTSSKQNRFKKFKKQNVKH